MTTSDPVQTTPPKAAAANTAETRQQDRTLLNAACVDLICQLESTLSKVMEFRANENLGEIVPLVNQSLLKVLEFGEAHLHERAAEDLNDRVLQAYEVSKNLSSAISSRQWKTVRSIIGRKSASEFDVFQMHGELGECFAVAVVASLGVAIQQLQAQGEEAAELTQSLKLFMAELKKGW